jgi:hypothetical protein
MAGLQAQSASRGSGAPAMHGQSSAQACQYWQNRLKIGAPDKVRTRDPLITNQVLYQLSYKGSGGLISQDGEKKSQNLCLVKR